MTERAASSSHLSASVMTTPFFVYLHFWYLHFCVFYLCICICVYVYIPSNLCIANTYFSTFLHLFFLLYHDIINLISRHPFTSYSSLFLFCLIFGSFCLQGMRTKMSTHSFTRIFTSFFILSFKVLDLISFF